VNEIIEVALIIFGLIVLLGFAFPSLFESKQCPKCKATNSLRKTGIKDPQNPYVLESYKVELKCRNCGHSVWVKREGKSTGGGD